MMGMINNWKYLRIINYNGSLTYPRKIDRMTLDDQSIHLTQKFLNLDVFDQMKMNVSKNIPTNELIYNFTIDRPHYLKIKLSKNVNCTMDCDFKLKFTDKNNTLRIGYKYETNDFYLDRTESVQVNRYFNNVHKYKIKYQKLLERNEFDIDLILDLNSIELLTDQGLISMTALHLNNKIFNSFSLITNRNYRIKQFTVNYIS